MSFKDIACLRWKNMIQISQYILVIYFECCITCNSPLIAKIYHQLSLGSNLNFDRKF